MTGPRLRATGLTVAALLVAGLTWRLRPAAPTTATAPDADIVLGCAWLAWALGGYLAVAVAAAALGQLCGAAGRAGHALSRFAPAGVGRLVETAITCGVAAAVLGSTVVPAGAAVGGPAGHHASDRRSAQPAAPGDGLDWPGLTEPAQVVVHHPSPRSTPRPTPPPQPRPSRREQRPQVGLVSGGHAMPPAAGTAVVVQPGDSLWAIAARRLRRGASREAITAGWHEWYAANREVIGANPNLIYPGQRLRPPNASTHTHQPRSAR